MATKKIKQPVMSKKIARQLVYDKLALALSDLKPETKNKKFENRLRDTSKLFAAYVIKNADKKKPKAKAESDEKATPHSDNG